MNRQTTLPESGAQWICLAGCESDPNLYLEFARLFDAPESGGGDAVLEICATSQYRVSLNGRIIGRGPAICDTALRYYHRYPIPADALRPYGNLLTVFLFHDGAATETVQGFRYGKPGLLLRLLHSGGEIISDEQQWRVRRSPFYSARPDIMPTPAMLSKWGGYKEFSHGERHGEAMHDWARPGYEYEEKHGWAGAVAVAEALDPEYAARLLLWDGPELEETILTPRRLISAENNLGKITLPDALHSFPTAWGDHFRITIAPGEPQAMPSLTFDYGHIVVGQPEIQMSGGKCIYEIWYGETLDMMRCDVARPGADGNWRAFQRRAYRYIKLVFIALEGLVALDWIRHHNFWYAYDQRGELETNDDFANRILSVTRLTQKANSSYHYEDCPVREQALWVMDMRIMARVNAYLFGNHELTAKCLRQCFALQKADGSVPSTGPRDNAFYHPDFALHLVATLREHYQHTGDAALVRELLPAVRPVADWIATYRGEYGLLDSDGPGKHEPFLDWSSRIEKRGETTILNALYKRFLEDWAALEIVGGEAARVADLRREAEALGERIRRRLFWEERGMFRDSVRFGKPVPVVSQQANLAALYAGIVPLEDAARLLNAVWESPDLPRPFGPSFYLIVMDALAAHGRTDLLWPLISDYWGAMLARGATTWWEVFDPTTPAHIYPHPFLGNVPTFECDWIPISACHGWSNVPGYAIPQFLLGVDLSGVADGRIAVRPTLPDEWETIRYAVPVAGGMLRLDFRRSGARTHVEVREAPPEIAVDVVGKL